MFSDILTAGTPRFFSKMCTFVQCIDLVVRIPQLGAKEGTQRYRYRYDSDLEKLDRRKVLL